MNMNFMGPTGMGMRPGMGVMGPGVMNPGMGPGVMNPGMNPGMPPMMPGRMSGMDRFKQILLWVGWIVTIIAIICFAVVYFMSKGMLEDAQSNYDRIDKVRAKTVEAVKVEINRYLEAVGETNEASQ
jgi:hypothetical protein